MCEIYAEYTHTHVYIYIYLSRALSCQKERCSHRRFRIAAISGSHGNYIFASSFTTQNLAPTESYYACVYKNGACKRFARVHTSECCLHKHSKTFWIVVKEERNPK